MRALLLSAYAAQSHRHWRQALTLMFPDWQWQVLELPPRFFSWRVRGNPLSWALEQRELLSQPYDVAVATSMVDLATLRGLVPALSQVPTLYYFHENQFAYPQHRQQHSLLEAQMVSLYGALAADRIAFNSAYNLDSFFTGLAALLDRLPDAVPAGVVAGLRARSEVLPVPLLPDDLAVRPGYWPGTQGDYPTRPLRLLWSGRFEHDKGGDGLLALLQALETTGLAYELAVTGQQFRDSPPVFARIQHDFAHRLVQFGYVESAEAFGALQAGADLVLATALHEFQGLAVQQAVAAGCLPLVPDRLAYRELYDQRWRYASCPEEPATEAAGAAQRVQALALALADGVRAPAVTGFGTDALAPAYRRALAACGTGQDSHTTQGPVS